MKTLATLSRPSGGLAMVALDQRESLRTMLAEAVGPPVADADLTEFKLTVATELGPHASGLLIDRDHGFNQVAELGLSCGLVLAADTLIHPVEGGPVARTELDDTVDPFAALDRGADALKLLVIWRAEERDACLDTADQFIRRCTGAGLVSVLEGVVRPGPDDDFDRLLVEAATELGALRPTLYKGQVPRCGIGDPGEIARLCERMTSVLPVPWVVLSQGVSIADFPSAVRIACQAGASGFLAGRAVWSDTLADPVALLRSRSVDRLRALAEIVDSSARPWRDVD
jgi:sulfofructosephosphate aldolase